MVWLILSRKKWELMIDMNEPSNDDNWVSAGCSGHTWRKAIV